MRMNREEIQGRSDADNGVNHSDGGAGRSGGDALRHDAGGGDHRGGHVGVKDIDPVNGLIAPRIGKITCGQDLYEACARRRNWRKRVEEAKQTNWEMERYRLYERRTKRK